MRTAPRQPYNGITIVIDKPSRFDLKTNELISSQPAQFFEDEILAPDYTLNSCNIIEAKESLLPLLPDTKHILLLGASSAAAYNFDINLHGYPAQLFDIPVTVAFYPQDCCDHRNVEWADNEDENDDTTSDRDIKDSAPTRRSNYRFWTKWHIRKSLYSKIPATPEIQPVIYPNLSNLARLFSNVKAEDVYLDIETSRINRCLTCIGLSSSSLFPRVYVIPIYLYTGDCAYSDIHNLYRLLFRLIKTNRVVAHNSSFDLLVLRAFYKLPLPDNIDFPPYDTLLANHRIFPEVEKSLAHVIAQWTGQKYHKNVATEVFNRAQQSAMWEYNARDVYNLKLIKDAQLNYASSRPGLTASIEQANAMIVPYLSNSLLGLRVDLAALTKVHAKLTAAQTIYSKICGLLCDKPTFNPGSSKQCKEYLHDKLNYPVITRSDKPPYDPKLGKKQLYQLLIKTNNPLIKSILKYRKVAKDTSMLECELWTPDTL